MDKLLVETFDNIENLCMQNGNLINIARDYCKWMLDASEDTDAVSNLMTILEIISDKQAQLFDAIEITGVNIYKKYSQM